MSISLIVKRYHFILFLVCLFSLEIQARFDSKISHPLFLDSSYSFKIQKKMKSEKEKMVTLASNSNQIDSEVKKVESSPVQTDSEVKKAGLKPDQTHLEVKKAELKLDQNHSKVKKAESNPDQIDSEVKKIESRPYQTHSEVKKAELKLDQTHSEVKKAESNLNQTHSEVKKAELKPDQTDSEVKKVESNSDQTHSEVKKAGLKPESNLEKATLAGGCFWCVESDMEKLYGVQEVISGYTGGNRPNPSYKEVSSGVTGHVEAIQITFDPKK